MYDILESLYTLGIYSREIIQNGYKYFTKGHLLYFYSNMLYILNYIYSRLKLSIMIVSAFLEKILLLIFKYNSLYYL